ncbi:nmrA-like family domain-containing protein [Trichoderma breve]|uniref:NmrA-like family domain-containing protein n=1 Tax=Trichoderma breve TaxID=2034170 RepID=A0A9W9B782_9HYPO|nr:nmrA-like family domain-containing protein [Trichoderma breve]KAJ4857873.1 nmrA-like family domain-containing protein [Trichoderma breve]
MADQKLIVVLGATGNQGSSVVDTFLKDAAWRVRGLTRNPSSAKAKALSARGVEVVQADMDDVSSLSVAFREANAIFVVSDFWGIYGALAQQEKGTGEKPLNMLAGETELQQLKNAIDAASQVPSLERFILSTLSNVTKWSGGKYIHVYHFDFKSLASAYIEDKHPELWAKTSLFQAGLFLSTFVDSPSFMPRKIADGTAQFTTTMAPDVKFPWIAAEEDTGPFVKALVQEKPGKNLIAYREWATLREMVGAFQNASKTKSEVVVVPRDEANEFLPPDLKLEIDEGFLYFEEFGYEGRDDPTVVHPSQLKNPPELDTMEQYFRKVDLSRIFSA